MSTDQNASSSEVVLITVDLRDEEVRHDMHD